MQVIFVADRMVGNGESRIVCDCMIHRSEILIFLMIYISKIDLCPAWQGNPVKQPFYGTGIFDRFVCSEQILYSVIISYSDTV